MFKQTLVLAAVLTASATSLAACYYPDREDYRYREYAYNEPGRYYSYDRDWRLHGTPGADDGTGNKSILGNSLN